MRTGQELSSVVGGISVDWEWYPGHCASLEGYSEETGCPVLPSRPYVNTKKTSGAGPLGEKGTFSFYMNKGTPRSGLCEHHFQSSKASLRLAQTQPDSPLFHFSAKITLPLGNGSQLWGGEGLCLKEREVYVLCFGIKNTRCFFFFSVNPEKP